MTTDIAIHWFRQDLRLSDNPALTLAANHRKILPIYIFDDLSMGAASRWWLNYSLHALNKSLEGRLSVYHGDAIEIMVDLIERLDIRAIYWNRCYEPLAIARDRQLKQLLTDSGVKVKSTNGSLLWEPWTVQKNDGTPYRVFTPFYRNGCLKAAPPRTPLPAPEHVQYHHDKQHACAIDTLNLLPKIRWDKRLEPIWHIGELEAQKRFHTFIDHGLAQYKQGRDFPAKPYVSRLSPHIHFGEISPNQLWHGLQHPNQDCVDHFRRELAWREFSYSQLYYNPELQHKNLQHKFDRFSWRNDNAALKAWQLGQTGIPMVDAGMRELWHTGYMHNRVRMIVGSFLVKNLRIHWHHGEQWFWDTLVDADMANNAAGWQWVAGCGYDAAPYFRIFNPVTQGQKFDPDGIYIRQYIPEIAALPNKYLFSPWLAPTEILAQANIELDKTYPHPIVDLKRSREAALTAFHSLKQ